MTAAEKKCRLFKNDCIPFLPVVGEWIKRLNQYQWIQNYKSGKQVNESNLFRTCQRMGIGLPDFMILDYAKLNKFACIRKLEEIKKYASEYRQNHLQSRIDKARLWKDEKTEKATINILKWGYDKKKFSRLQVTMGKQ